MKILVFAPHNDDEVLGVGGTIARYSQEGHEVYVCEVTSGDASNPLVNHIKQEALRAHTELGVKETRFLDMPVVALHEMPTIRKNRQIAAVVQDIKPSIVYLPHRGDIHIDHQEVSSAVMVACRPVDSPWIKAIYAYETLSETEWHYPTADKAFIPNTFVDITETLQKKIIAMKCYATQIKQYPNPRSIVCIEALARMRGSTVCVHAAEAFMLLRKLE